MNRVWLVTTSTGARAGLVLLTAGVSSAQSQELQNHRTLPKAFSTVCRDSTVEDMDSLIARRILGMGYRDVQPPESAKASYVRLAFSFADTSVMHVVIAAHPTTYDIAMVGLAYGDCLGLWGVRSMFGTFHHAARVEWNTVLDSLAPRLAINDAESARSLAQAFLTYASGRPLVLRNEPQNPRVIVHGDISVDHSGWSDLGTAIYESAEEDWRVDGSLCQAHRCDMFRISFSRDGRVHSVTMLPNDP